MERLEWLSRGFAPHLGLNCKPYTACCIRMFVDGLKCLEIRKMFSDDSAAV